MKRLMRQAIQENMPCWHEVPAKLRLNGSIPEQIRRVRETLGMTQAQLAARAGMKNPSAIANIENNPQADLQLSTIQRISTALGCEFLSGIIPQEKIAKRLEARSEEVAQKLIAISAGNAALEMQLPDAKSVTLSVENMKRDLMEKHRKWLWEKI